jgi:hypothetical protein
MAAKLVAGRHGGRAGARMLLPAVQPELLPKSSFSDHDPELLLLFG